MKRILVQILTWVRIYASVLLRWAYAFWWNGPWPPVTLTNLSVKIRLTKWQMVILRTKLITKEKDNHTIHKISNLKKGKPEIKIKHYDFIPCCIVLFIRNLIFLTNTMYTIACHNWVFKPGVCTSFLCKVDCKKVIKLIFYDNQNVKLFRWFVKKKKSAFAKLFYSNFP